MSEQRKDDRRTGRAFLGRLARDTRANTLAMMAIAVIPLAGMVGGGVDLARLYIVKTRLQHACDAGALAGRKTMGGGTWSYNNYAARTEAERFFDANIQASPYGATGLTKTFSESAGKVTGTASATVPMTLMRIFLRTTETLSVTCDAEMRLPNTDVMFVLDTTGSMDWCPNGDTSCNGDANSRIAALRTAVKCFYEVVARLNSEENCSGGNPSGGTSSTVQIRFGFVPYSTNVNVGKLLPNSYLVDSAQYQTRVANWTPPGTTETNWYWEIYSNSISSSDCFSYMKNEAFSGFTPTPVNGGGPAPAPTVVRSFWNDGSVTSGGSGEWGWYGASDDNGTKRSCRRARKDTTTTYVDTFKSWDYKQAAIDVSDLKAGGSTWNNAFDAPVGPNGTSASITWNGCIEERDTTRTTDFDPIPSAAKDLDIDLVPSSDATRWRPALPNVVFMRNKTSGSSTSGLSYNPTTDVTDNYRTPWSAYCPREARKMQAWNTASTFDAYVNSLDPSGNTYHDIGLLWGARLMSATGIFATENATTPQGGDIERHMIFMTDGDTNANADDYAAYGLPWFDRRQTASANVPSKAQLDEQVNLRFSALCSAIKNKNITLWVVNFGEGQAQATKDRLEACATPGKFFDSPDAATLQANFRAIADQISQLRLTK